MPHLEHWGYVALDDDGFRAPETLTWALGGIVTGHPEIADGTQIRTSRLLTINDERTEARTYFRSYTLGTPAALVSATGRSDKI